MENFEHIPVLAKETVNMLSGAGSGKKRFIDCTVGCGGHSALLLERNTASQLLAIDRDEWAIARAKERLAFAGERVKFVHAPFSRVFEVAEEEGFTDVDGILMDIGVSSPQIDDLSRGFSYRSSAPLDMRMDRTQRLTAEEVVNDYPERELARIFRDYGELRDADRLARAIACDREKERFSSCKMLADVAESVLHGYKGGRRSGPPAPTLVFQAIRIEVNGELDELRRGLEGAVKLLAPAGRLAVISFHSLEDRIVKRFFAGMAVECKCPPGMPECRCNWKPLLSVLTKKPVEADKEEKKTNTRSACAKLRVAERTANEMKNEEDLKRI